MAILFGIIYFINNKSNRSNQSNQLNQCETEINEATFNPQYKITKDKNGLEVVHNCKR